ncbi:MAG TPA: amino acid permease [Candidatus Thermoplasmatota archaeon]|nr:amino acid permease [Candidatus Thermoplasmatota archaeon]
MDPALPVRSEADEAGPEQEVRLAREITLVDATMMGVGALMGGGVFVLLGLATGVAGNTVLLALFLNGFITIPTLLVYAELGSASDDAGGGYLWVKQGLGQPFGFLGGWFSWFSHAIACSLYSIASAAFITYLASMAGWLPSDLGASWHGLPISLIQALAVGLSGLFVALNYAGVKVGIKAENVINTVVLAAVLVFLVAGFWAVSRDPALAKANLLPFFREGSAAFNLSNVFLAMGITFIAFEGYEIISQTSEEMQDPKRNIPRAIWASFLIVWSVMLCITFIALAATRAPGDGQSWLYLGALQETALITVADQVMPYGTLLVACAALLLQLTALNATIYSSSRVSFAMGRDGNLPKPFGAIHPKRRTPHKAVLGSGVLIVAMALLPIATVAASADVMFLLLFLLVNLSYIKLRKTIPQERFGFRAPLFPYLPILGICSQFFLAVYLYKYDPHAWHVTLAWLATGLLFYYAYVRRREASAPAPPPPLPTVRLPLARHRRGFRVLVLIATPAASTARSLAQVAGRIAQSLDGEVLLLQAVIVPELTPLSEGHVFYKERAVLQQARAAVPQGVPAQPLVRIGHNLDALVREVVREEGATLLLMSGQARFTVGQPTSPLLVYPPCDVAVLRLRTPEVKAGRVLVTSHAGQHTALGVRLATALAKTEAGEATLYKVEEPEQEPFDPEWGKAVAAANAVPGSQVRVEHEPGPVVKRILDKARGYDLVVVGARVVPRLGRKTLLGPRTQEITDRASVNLLIVRNATPGGDRLSWVGRRLMTVRKYFQPE